MATNDTSTEFRAEIAALRKDLATLRDDLAALARTAADASTSGPAQIGESVRHKAAELGEKGSEIVSSVGRQIEEKPLASVAVAFGVGLLIGKLLDRHGANEASHNAKANV